MTEETDTNPFKFLKQKLGYETEIFLVSFLFWSPLSASFICLLQIERYNFDTLWSPLKPDLYLRNVENYQFSKLFLMTENATQIFKKVINFFHRCRRLFFRYQAQNLKNVLLCSVPWNRVPLKGLYSSSSYTFFQCLSLLENISSQYWRCIFYILKFIFSLWFFWKWSIYWQYEVVKL